MILVGVIDYDAIVHVVEYLLDFVFGRVLGVILVGGVLVEDGPTVGRWIRCQIDETDMGCVHLKSVTMNPTVAITGSTVLEEHISEGVVILLISAQVIYLRHGCIEYAGIDYIDEVASLARPVATSKMSCARLIVQTQCKLSDFIWDMEEVVFHDSLNHR